jgi:hypothetical protein
MERKRETAEARVICKQRCRAHSRAGLAPTVGSQLERFVIPGCANRTRVYPSSAISLSKSTTADLDGAGPESILTMVVMDSGLEAAPHPGMTGT